MFKLEDIMRSIVESIEKDTGENVISVVSTYDKDEPISDGEFQFVFIMESGAKLPAVVMIENCNDDGCDVTVMGNLTRKKKRSITYGDMVKKAHAEIPNIVLKKIQRIIGDRPLDEIIQHGTYKFKIMFDDGCVANVRAEYNELGFRFHGFSDAVKG